MTEASEYNTRRMAVTRAIRSFNCSFEDRELAERIKLFSDWNKSLDHANALDFAIDCSRGWATEEIMSRAEMLLTWLSTGDLPQ